MANDADTLVQELRELLARAARLATELAAAEPAEASEQQAQEEENRRLAEQNVELEGQMNRMTTLWVAATRLHDSLALESVVEALSEILIGLVGAEEFSILLLDSAAGEYVPVASEGERSRVGRFHSERSPLGAVLAEGSVHYSGDVADRPQGWPLLAIPLHVEGRGIGAVLVFKLVDHKPSFSALDDELFRLLAHQAAIALRAAQLHFESKRKLATLQGVIDEFIAQGSPAARASAPTRRSRP